MRAFRRRVGFCRTWEGNTYRQGDQEYQSRKNPITECWSHLMYSFPDIQTSPLMTVLFARSVPKILLSEGQQQLRQGRPDFIRSGDSYCLDDALLVYHDIDGHAMQSQASHILPRCIQ